MEWRAAPRGSLTFLAGVICLQACVDASWGHFASVVKATEGVLTCFLGLVQRLGGYGRNEDYRRHHVNTLKRSFQSIFDGLPNRISLVLGTAFKHVEGAMLVVVLWLVVLVAPLPSRSLACNSTPTIARAHSKHV